MNQAPETSANTRPILFTGQMVRAILEGRKTQTRRVVKPQPSASSVDHRLPSPSPSPSPSPTPYGGPGDHLWVKETHAPRADVDYSTEPEKARHYCMYRATGGDPRDTNNWHDFGGAWRPSIFMPRALSRITLEIVSVRMERAWEITHDDVAAEGIARGGDGSWLAPLGGHEDFPYAHAHEAFRALWDSINAKRGFGWNTNPRVWVITFKRI